ncbi:MAG: LacI family transcriptional regulator [Chloroflexota bacterium]|nr:LacI family transcriptional regulator [Chloroflexota bacterium]
MTAPPVERRAGRRVPPNATLRDVADVAGVSIATVSRVLTGARASRPDTRDRVLAAAVELDYRPSALGRALKLQQTHTLGLLITDIENPFFPEIVRAVEDAAHQRGYAILLCSATDEPRRELAYINLLLERRVDGIIVAASQVPARHAALLARAPVPVVLVNCAAPRSGLASISSDNRGGGRAAAEHLLGLGHLRLGLITGPPANAAAAVRLAGVQDAIRAAGTAEIALTIVEGDAHVAGGERATRQLLDLAPLTTAIVCYNDLTAMGVMRALRALGRVVPDDVSVVGFDDIDLAQWTDPPLTTIAQQKAEMGRWAFAHIADAIGRGHETAPTRRLATSLVIRGSSARPKGNRPDA